MRITENFVCDPFDCPARRQNVIKFPHFPPIAPPQNTRSRKRYTGGRQVPVQIKFSHTANFSHNMRIADSDAGGRSWGSSRLCRRRVGRGSSATASGGVGVVVVGAGKKHRRRGSAGSMPVPVTPCARKTRKKRNSNGRMGRYGETGALAMCV